MKSIYRNSFLLFIFLVCFKSPIYSESDYILPLADSRENVSPVSIRGILERIKDSIIVTKNDIGNNGKSIKIRITIKSKIFTEYGGHIELSELSPGQYVWIWYKTRNVKNAGNPPETAVLILWSKDPNDQPSNEDKKRYDKENKTK